ncbi:2606_t:CDS:2, partial [Cetraspora pellucida]
MPAILKIPETIEEYQSIVAYLQSKTISLNIQGSKVKYKFEKRCKRFELDDKALYIPAVYKDRKIKHNRHCVVLKYDIELCALLLEHFHDNANHHSYHSTYSALSEKHIRIVQVEVQEYQHIQIDLIGFQDYAKINHGYAWLLTCICIFSKYLIAIPMKNKEANTVVMHLVQNVFKIFGLLVILQSDNGKEFVANIVKLVCGILKIKIKHRRPCHPQTQGQQKDWINVVDTFVISYNSTVHKAHGHTPHEIMFRWNMHGVYDLPEAIQSNEPILLDNANNENLKNDVKQHIEQVSQTQQSVNNLLEKYQKKMCLYGSVHHKKTKNNTIQPGTMVFVAPDHDTNVQTQKRKL